MPQDTCSVENCERPPTRRSWCDSHYRRLRAAPSCSIEGCGKPARTRGWCNKHYLRWWHNGQLDLLSWEERFWANVDKHGPIPEHRPELGPCWLWLGSLSAHGYGIASRACERVWAYRVTYELLIGPIPDGLQPDHLCRRPVCVNPAHLEPVTPRINTLRGNAPSAINARKTHCPQGHAYDEANTRYNKYGHRQCRACDRESQRRIRSRKRANIKG